MSFPSPHDRRLKEIVDEDDPVDRMISRTGCAELHYAVQACMAENQDWRACQKQVQNFKDCMMNFQKGQKEQRERLNKASTPSVAS
nr:cytochrome c oxidase assembly factor 4 homolog, mitochondrial [Nothobranchius furzeri]